MSIARAVHTHLERTRRVSKDNNKANACVRVGGGVGAWHRRSDAHAAWTIQPLLRGRHHAEASVAGFVGVNTTTVHAKEAENGERP